MTDRYRIILPSADTPEFSASPSGLWLPEDVLEERLRELKRPTCVDLFCGAGGFSLGMIQAGFKVMAGVDNDPTCAMTYCINLGTYPMQFVFATDEDRERLKAALGKGSRYDKGTVRPFPRTGSARPADREPVETFILGDMRLLKGHHILEAIGMEVGELDCVVGSPPCQGFSRLGKQNVMDPRNSLVFELMRLVLEMRPKAVCMENVPGILDMVTPDGLPVVEALGRILEDGDFCSVKTFQNTLRAQHPNALSLLRGLRRGTEADQIEDDEVKQPGQQDLFT